MKKGFFDYVGGFFLWAASLFLIFCVFVLALYAVQEFFYLDVPVVKVKSTLISHGFSPSTLKTHVAPIIGPDGTSCAIYTTGDSEKTITIWDCGKYGRLICDDKRVYQYAKPDSTLMIRHSEYATRIVGICVDDEEFEKFNG